MKEYIYGLFYHGEQIDETSLDEMNENLAWDIMIEDHESKDKNLLSVQLTDEREEQD